MATCFCHDTDCRGPPLLGSTAHFAESAALLLLGKTAIYDRLNRNTILHLFPLRARRVGHEVPAWFSQRRSILGLVMSRWRRYAETAVDGGQRPSNSGTPHRVFSCSAATTSEVAL